MQKIRLGMIGLGVMGKRMAQSIDRYSLHDRIEIRAVCDINEQVAKDFTTQFANGDWTTDEDEVIQRKDIDLIYVASPPAHHYATVLKAIRHKKHILCEKPLANSIEEAAEMLAAAKEAGIVHAMNFPLNYSPALPTLEKLISEGYIGEVRRIRLDMHFPHWPRAWQQNRWIASRKQGGFILEVGVHWIQAMQKLFGKIVNVHSEVQFPEDPSLCEHSIIAKLELENGTPVTIDGISGIAGNERIALVVYGREGMLAIENWGELYGGKANGPLERIPLDNHAVQSPLLENVVKAIHGEPANIYDFHVGYDAQVILEALRNPK